MLSAMFTKHDQQPVATVFSGEVNLNDIAMGLQEMVDLTTEVTMTGIHLSLLDNAMASLDFHQANFNSTVSDGGVDKATAASTAFALYNALAPIGLISDLGEVIGACESFGVTGNRVSSTVAACCSMGDTFKDALNDVIKWIKAQIQKFRLWLQSYTDLAPRLAKAAGKIKTDARAKQGSQLKDDKAKMSVAGSVIKALHKDGTIPTDITNEISSYSNIVTGVYDGYMSNMTTAAKAFITLEAALKPDADGMPAVKTYGDAVRSAWGAVNVHVAPLLGGVTLKQAGTAVAGVANHDDDDNSILGGYIEFAKPKNRNANNNNNNNNNGGGATGAGATGGGSDSATVKSWVSNTAKVKVYLENIKDQRVKDSLDILPLSMSDIADIAETVESAAQQIAKDQQKAIKGSETMDDLVKSFENMAKEVGSFEPDATNSEHFAVYRAVSQMGRTHQAWLQEPAQSLATNFLRTLKAALDLANASMKMYK